MKSRIGKWTLTIANILISGFIIIGLLPVSIPDFWSNYDKPNVLKVEGQDCGCPSGDVRILKGRLSTSKLTSPELAKLDLDKEINLTGNTPFHKYIESDGIDFVYHNSFKIQGELVGIDTLYCDSTKKYCETVGRFKVNNWSLTSYYPIFWIMSKNVMLAYLGCWFLGIPIMLPLNLVAARKKRKLKKELAID